MIDKTVTAMDCLGAKCTKCKDTNCLWYYLTGHVLGKPVKKEDEK